MSEWGQVDPDGPNSNQCQLVLSVITKDRQTNTHKRTHTYTDRMAMPWSMGPWAGLKRRHILEACSSSLMSNLPHQKNFIPINKAFGKGALHRPSTVPTAHHSVCGCASVCALNRGYVGVCILCMSDARFSFEAVH